MVRLCLELALKLGSVVYMLLGLWARRMEKIYRVIESCAEIREGC